MTAINEVFDYEWLWSKNGMRYTKKYHMVGVEEFIDNKNFGKVDFGNEGESNDDDCMVLFPGEETRNFKEAVELDSDNDRDRFLDKE